MKKKRLKSFADKENIWSDKEWENGGKYAGLAKSLQYHRGRWVDGCGGGDIRQNNYNNHKGGEHRLSLYYFPC